jgi:circadian clock protein KaiC
MIKRDDNTLTDSLAKTLTGIPGLDEITGGGWPTGRTTLIEGGPGCGKTILALQSLVNNAVLFGKPGIFVAFEESSLRIIANAAKFGWDLPGLQEKKLFFLDAHPNPDLLISGSFDLTGMLAVLGAKRNELKAEEIVFDSLDMVMSLLNDPQAERREIYRLHDWLLDEKLTALITCKRNLDGTIPPPLNFMQFMVDCAVILKHEVIEGISQRSLRVSKYRGSGFDENESPFVIDSSGIDVARISMLDRAGMDTSKGRVSSGVARLDTVLGGGYYAESSVLITGEPGTAKTTLSGTFVEAACRLGEVALFVSFDSDASDLVRNLASVNVQLDDYVKKGLLHVVTMRSVASSAEIHLMRIKNLARKHSARYVVVDPVSALSKSGNPRTVHSVAERLLDWAKSEKITLLCTSLVVGDAPTFEGAPLPISTLADTWIQMGYVVHSGERNRSLSVVKSRGTWHSNQVRELLLSANGVSLTDAYIAGGEVLMGTLRWEKERYEEAARAERMNSVQQKRTKLEAEETDLQLRLSTLQREIGSKRIEIASLTRGITTEERDMEFNRLRLSEMRGADNARVITSE